MFFIARDCDTEPRVPRRKKEGARKQKQEAAKKEDRRRTAILKSFAAHLRRIRLEQDLAQEVVAARAGMTPQHLGLIERALVNPSLVTVVRLAEALGFGLGDFVQTLPFSQTAAKEPLPPPRTRVTRRKPY